jgi:4-diphosphocytidyl-2-C-methyl-D-erythritol kinase
VLLLAPAKINLHLRVGQRRDDGFHPLLTWMCTVGLFDKMTIRPASDGREKPSGVELTCDNPDLACDRSNLIARAAEALLEWRQFDGRAGKNRRCGYGASVALEKRIPLGGGLGGGSSDGARALLGLNRFWHLGLEAAELHQSASALGSDVPFFLYGPSSICEGRGQQVRPILPPAASFAVLVLPPLSISTAAAYRRFDELDLGEEQSLKDQPDWTAWTGLSAQSMLPRLVNDLERPAFDLCPQLALLREKIAQELGRPVRMSGSGSTLFTLYDDRGEAQDAVDAITRSIGVRAELAQLAPHVQDDLNTPGTSV